jgi:HlyD family secretion protein
MPLGVMVVDMKENAQGAISPIISKKPRRKQKKLNQWSLAVFILIVLGLLGAGAWYFMAPKNEDFVLSYYLYSIVQNRDFLINVTANGLTRPKEEIVLKAATSATVDHIAVQEGDDVVKGAVLMRLASETLNTQLLEAERRVWQAEYDYEKLLVDQEMEAEKQERDIASLQRQLADAQADWEQQKQLYALGTVARRDLERSEQNVSDLEYNLNRTERLYVDMLERHAMASETAREKVLAEQTNLQELQAIRDSLVVTAPISGRVINLHVQPGEDVAGNASLITIADVVDPVVVINVDANMVDLLQPNHAAVIKTALNSYSGQVTYISPRAAETSSGAVVETHVQTVGGIRELRPGTAVSVEIEVGRRNSPYLPRGPYLSSGQQLFVYVVQGEQAVRRNVTYGMIESAAVEILSGLSPGEKVIISSYDEYRHLERVNVVPEGGHKQ